MFFFFISYLFVFFFFFFSSRRRHTRSYGDWSSDVCSSDLHQHSAGENVVGRDFALVVGVPHEREAAFVSWVGLRVGRLEGRAARVRVRGSWCGAVRREGAQSCIRTQIGRAAIPSAIRENVGTGQ